MKIVELSKETENLYFVCLEKYSKDKEEEDIVKNDWYNKMKEKGLVVKLALDDWNDVIGFIQYVPIEHSYIEGSNLYVINCIWINDKKRANKRKLQKKNIGSDLLLATEDDLKRKGAKGIVAFSSLIHPYWMKTEWFEELGYEKIEQSGAQILLWKSLTTNVSKPQWLKQRKILEPLDNKVIVSAFINDWCPTQNIAFKRAKKVASEFGDKVIFREINTLESELFLEWGVCDELYINEEQVKIWPPPSYKKIKKLIVNKIKKLN